eukprot:m.76998 g.76998  ORF g.76998 m.76998 type:complete len:442 (+) comp14052_c0_seq1:41-1366(+)
MSGRQEEHNSAESSRAVEDSVNDVEQDRINDVEQQQVNREATVSTERSEESNPEEQLQVDGKDATEAAAADGDDDDEEADEEGEEMCMPDYVTRMNEEDELEVALFGGQDENVCTAGDAEYQRRQSLFACLTCYQETGVYAGICLGCRHNCHTGHEIVELYTKRNFVCDCGTSRTGKRLCRLKPGKVAHEGNKYNHNFQGLFCHCHRPYPDASLEKTGFDETMAQCQICEDWMHLEAIDGNHSAITDLSEVADAAFYCGTCQVKHAWLFERLTSLDMTTGDYAAENVSTDDYEACFRSLRPICFAQSTLSENAPSAQRHPAFFYRLRDVLCRCNDCRAKLKESGLEFLVDPRDTMQYFEEQNRHRHGEQIARLAQDITHRIRQQPPEVQIAAARFEADFSTYIRARLQAFAEAGGQVVDEATIREFLADFEEENRQKRAKH